ncbi:MAG: hypothetical protein ACYTHM_21020, partial [Planctomycetota bacterium]
HRRKKQEYPARKKGKKCVKKRLGFPGNRPSENVRSLGYRKRGGLLHPAFFPGFEIIFHMIRQTVGETGRIEQPSYRCP